jgi:hypothetical protein
MMENGLLSKEHLKNSAAKSKKELKKSGELTKQIDERLVELAQDDELREKGLYQIRGRGVVWLRPFVDSVVKINVASQTTPMERFPLDSLDGPQVEVIPGITWNVRADGDNPYKALFEINNEKETKVKEKTHELEQTVSWICSAGLTQVLRNRKYEEIRNFDPKEITDITRQICGDDLLRFGVNLSDVWLKFPAYTPAERLAQALEGKPDPDKAAIVAGAVGNVVPLRGGDAA